MEDEEIWSILSTRMYFHGQGNPEPLTEEADKFSLWLYDGKGLPDLNSWLDYDEVAVKDQDQGQSQDQGDQPEKKKRGRKLKPFKLVRKERRRLSSLRFKALELQWVNLTAADFESSIKNPADTGFNTSVNASLSQNHDDSTIKAIDLSCIPDEPPYRFVVPRKLIDSRKIAKYNSTLFHMRLAGWLRKEIRQRLIVEEFNREYTERSVEWCFLRLRTQKVREKAELAETLKEAGVSCWTKEDDDALLSVKEFVEGRYPEVQDEKEIWELIHREMFKRHPLGVYSAELCHARYLEKQTGTALPCVDEVENSPKEAAEMLRQRLQSKALIKNYQEQLPAFRESNPDI